MFASRLFNDPFFSAPAWSSFPTLGETFDRDPFFTRDPAWERLTQPTLTQPQQPQQQAQLRGRDVAQPAAPAVNSVPQTQAAPVSQSTEQSQQPQQPQQQLSVDRASSRWLGDPWSSRLDRWGGGVSDFGFGLGGMLDEMDRSLRHMNRVMRHFEQQLPSMADLSLDSAGSAAADGGDVQPQSSSWSSSSTRVTHYDADGKAHSRESRAERRRVGGVLEEKRVERDSAGNERSVMRRGLGDKLREVVCDVNAAGEKRQTENLRHIAPEEVDQFDREWSEARSKADPKQRLLGRLDDSQQPQAQLTAGGDPSGAQAKHETAAQAQLKSAASQDQKGGSDKRSPLLSGQKESSPVRAA